MKLAVLLQCHKSSKQINYFLEALQHHDIYCFIHVDKKSNISEEITKSKNIIILPDEMRVDVQWAQYSQVEATLNLLKFAMSKCDFDYYCLVSGQDFSITSPEKILNFLEQGKNANYVNLFESLNNGAGHSNNYDKRNQIFYPNWILNKKKSTRILRRLWVAISGGYNHTFKFFIKKQLKNTKFYFGSSWWCIHKDFANYIFEYLKCNSYYEDFFRSSCCADESFFQTLLMNSPYRDTRKDYLHYIDWSQGGSSPKNLTCVDFDHIINSEKLFARKIDEDYELLDMLKKHQDMQ